MLNRSWYNQTKITSQEFSTCLDDTSYSSSHPLWALSKDDILRYLLLSSARDISLDKVIG